MLKCESYELVVESDLDYKKAIQACVNYLRGTRLSENEARQFKSLPLHLIYIIDLATDKYKYNKNWRDNIHPRDKDEWDEDRIKGEDKYGKDCNK